MANVSLDVAVAVEAGAWAGVTNSVTVLGSLPWSSRFFMDWIVLTASAYSVGVTLKTFWGAVPTSLVSLASCNI